MTLNTHSFQKLINTNQNIYELFDDLINPTIIKQHVYWLRGQIRFLFYVESISLSKNHPQKKTKGLLN